MNIKILIYTAVIIAVSASAYFIFSGRHIDIEEAINKSALSPKCTLTLSEKDITVTEGENFTIIISLETFVKEEFKISLRDEPDFILVNQTVFAGSENTPFEIQIINASNLKLEWKKIEITASANVSCSEKFNLIILDNCPDVYNPDQLDIDNDSIGDACDNQSCGDLICNNETNCCIDCGCLPGQTCDNNNCTGTPYKCIRDNDCNDTIVCTVDICYHKNTSNSFCGHLDISTCKDNDNCCTSGCNANNDNNCPPECGNDVCEDIAGETHSNCSKDCPEED